MAGKVQDAGIFAPDSAGYRRHTPPYKDHEASMKINVEFDLTPEELRQALGLPNIEAFQQDLLDRIHRQMESGVEGYDPMSLMQPFLQQPALQQGLAILDPLLPEELPSWVWWNGALDEAPELLQQLASSPRRLILDSALGDPRFCLNLLASRIEAGQAVNDLNWLRLGSWHQTLAMVFDPPHRRDALGHVIQLDIDVEGDHPVQGLLLGSWIADRLGWKLKHTQHNSDKSISTSFQRTDGTEVQMRVSPVPMGQPSIHPGQIVGLRLICKPEHQPAICVILCAESGGCMRLEAGGMASMELIEEVVPVQHSPVEADVSRQLEGGHDSTNPLLAAAAPLAAKLIS